MKRLDILNVQVIDPSVDGDNIDEFIYRPRANGNNIDFASLGRVSDSFAELPPDAA